MKGIKWLGALTRRFMPRPSPHIARGAFKRGFEAARLDRYSAGFLATEVSINQELRGDLNRLRARGRGLVKNNDYARKYRGMVEDNIVGPRGFVRQSRVELPNGKPDADANNSIESAYDRWKQVCDITGRQTYDGLIRTAVGSLPSDGEFLIRMIRGAEARNEFNFALQLIDVDRIDTQFNRTANSAQNAVVMGVELDSYRRPVAIHLFAGHPNDGEQSSRARQRVEMSDLIHYFRPDHPDQVRGVPWLAPSMLALHHLGGFTMSALLAAEHGANHFGFFEQSPEGMGPPTDGTDPATGEQISTSVPGVYDTLPHGVKFQPHESRFPDAAIEPFVKTLERRISSGLRVTRPALFSDLEGVSYSSIRQGELEVRDRWRVDQREVIDRVMARIDVEWLRMSLLSGAIISKASGKPLPASKFEKFNRREFQGRWWDWVDPNSDLDAAIKMVTAGFGSPQDIAARMGGDVEDNIVRLGEALKIARDNNVVLPAYEVKPGAIAQVIA